VALEEKKRKGKGARRARPAWPTWPSGHAAHEASSSSRPRSRANRRKGQGRGGGSAGGGGGRRRNSGGSVAGRGASRACSAVSSSSAALLPASSYLQHPTAERRWRRFPAVLGSEKGVVRTSMRRGERWVGGGRLGTPQLGVVFHATLRWPRTGVTTPTCSG
jgi:hypothetical protein